MLSLIIGTYNGENFVQDCLDCVFSQTISKDLLEVIVIDDGSTDGTAALLKEYQKQYSENMVLILRERNSRETLKITRNIGVNHAKGEYILFMDQDDWYRLDAFELLHNKIQEDETLDYIEYKLNHTDFDGNVIRTTDKEKQGYFKYEITNEAQRVKLAQCDILPGTTYAWAKIYRKSFLVENNIYHNDMEKYTGYSDNYFSGMVVTFCKKFAKYYEPLYFHRNYKGSYSRAANINDKNQFERCKVGIIYWEECATRGLLEEQREFIEYLFMCTFLLKTFWRFLENFDPIPYAILADMQITILQKCPKYYENSIMKRMKNFELLLELLKSKWTPEFLDNIKTMYLWGEIR